MSLSLKTVMINAAVVTALVGGTAAYTTFNNTVELSVDGRTESVQTFGDTVADVLADEGIEVAERDIVVPSPSSQIREGMKISVRYARQITVTIDGVKQEIWTTALSVEEALDDLGIRAAGAEVSVARSRGIGRGGLSFEVRTPKDVVLVADGEEREATTTAVTVRQALRDLGVELGERDLVEPEPDERVARGMELVVKRVTVDEETETVPIDYETERKTDDSMYEDESTVEQEGEDGELERVVEVVYVDGEEDDRRVVSETVVTEPVDRVVVEGTKERPEPEPDPPTGDAGVWDDLAQCESGGNWSINTGNGYYGGLQFSLQTWQAYGGSGYPHENSKAEQIRIAEKVVAARGHYGDWPACARELGLPTG
ncbi:MAG: ubiquitin-like domain-containing protein [Actinomycetota bacterium]